MHRKSGFTSLGRRLAVFAAVGFVSALVAGAQQPSASVGVQPALLLKSVVTGPLNLTLPEGVNYSSSTSAADIAEPAPLSLSANSIDQPPPRRRYGRPNYHDSRTNPDGSSKYAFVVGGGMTAPLGNTYKYLKTSYSIQTGVGRNFNRQFGILGQFNWDNFVFQSNNLGHQLTLYNSLGAVDQNGNPLGTLGGNSHLWSFSVNPVFNLSSSEGGGAYFVAGVGFYHKTATFTTPATVQSCYYYFGQPICYNVQANQPIDKYTSNAPGFSAGLGFTHKVSRFANERFYAEARYVFVDNAQRFLAGTPAASSTSSNLYPANSNRTSYVPITVGLRF